MLRTKFSFYKSIQELTHPYLFVLRDQREDELYLCQYSCEHGGQVSYLLTKTDEQEIDDLSGANKPIYAALDKPELYRVTHDGFLCQSDEDIEFITANMLTGGLSDVPVRNKPSVSAFLRAAA